MFSVRYTIGDRGVPWREDVVTETDATVLVDTCRVVRIVCCNGFYHLPPRPDSLLALAVLRKGRPFRDPSDTPSVSLASSQSLSSPSQFLGLALSQKARPSGIPSLGLC